MFPNSVTANRNQLAHGDEWRDGYRVSFCAARPHFVVMWQND
jgi:hypothetical protein